MEKLGAEAGRAHNDGKGDAKVVRQPPVALQLLLIAKLCQAVLIAFLIAVGGAALDRGLFGEAHGGVSGRVCLGPVCWWGITG